MTNTRLRDISMKYLVSLTCMAGTDDNGALREWLNNAIDVEESTKNTVNEVYSMTNSLSVGKILAGKAENTFFRVKLDKRNCDHFREAAVCDLIQRIAEGSYDETERLVDSLHGIRTHILHVFDADEEICEMLMCSDITSIVDIRDFFVDVLKDMRAGLDEHGVRVAEELSRQRLKKYGIDACINIYNREKFKAWAQGIVKVAQIMIGKQIGEQEG